MRKWNSINGFEYLNEMNVIKSCKSCSDFEPMKVSKTDIDDFFKLSKQSKVNLFDTNDIESGWNNPSPLSTDSSPEEWNIANNGFPAEIFDNSDPTAMSEFYCETDSNIAKFSNFINNLFENPEGRLTNLQRIAIFLYTCFETYRTIISSFLTVFVPQNCGGYSCTIVENIIPKDDLEIAAISINTFMAVYFCMLFTIESTRESIVKKYLTNDKSYATDKEYLLKMLSKMQKNERREIFKLNTIYRGFTQVLLVLFFINAGVSCVVIRKNYLNNTTSTVFITNMFFMINRIHKALKITSSGEYNIYSTYRTDNLIYNRYRGQIMHDRPPGIVFPYVYTYIQRYIENAKN